MSNDSLFAAIGDSLKAGNLVPYIGPAVFDLCGAECAIPRSSEDLVNAICAKAAAPGRIRRELSRVAQYVESNKHRQTLDRILTAAFGVDIAPTPVHEWVASRPEITLIVDAWYDSVADKALSGRSDWGQIQGISHPQSNGQWVQFFDSEGKEVDAAAAESWKTVLYKPNGAVAPAGNFLISDSDFVEMLTEIDIQTPIPDVVKERRTGRNFLYLGCRFDAELKRTFARQISKRSSDCHWAILPEEPTEKEQRFLEKYNVTPVYMPLAEAMEKLKAL